MRVVRNEGFIKKRLQFTQRGSLLGMGLLVVSFILSTRNQYQLTLAAWVLLLVGFVVAMVAVQVGNRYVRPPRPDTVLDKLLKGLDSRFVAYHYFYPAEHLLLTPSGLVAVQMQSQRGRVWVRGKRWRHGPFLQRLRVLLGESPMGNPAAELRRTMAETQKVLGALGDQVAALPMEGLVVFYADKVQLSVDEPEVPVVTAEQLKAKLREMADAHPALPSRSHKAAAAALAGQAPLEEEAEPQEEPAQAPKGRRRRR
jgi:hypothetical protein